MVNAVGTCIRPSCRASGQLGPGGIMGGVPAALDHVTLTVTDLAASIAFYDAALAPLGIERVHELGDEEEEQVELEAAAYGNDGHAVLWLVTGPVRTTAVHVAFRAAHRDQVEAFHRAGLAAGGRSHAAPRRWAIFRTGEFNAILRDADGNLVEAVSAE
jgi:catechol 2,3-dioxygenase-like lactoylglutathione lyase family enzyme